MLDGKWSLVIAGCGDVKAGLQMLLLLGMLDDTVGEGLNGGVSLADDVGASASRGVGGGVFFLAGRGLLAEVVVVGPFCCCCCCCLHLALLFLNHTWDGQTRSANRNLVEMPR